MLMPWNDSNKLGISIIDKQHCEMYTMLNELNRAIAEGRGKKVAAALMMRLTSLICEHFDAEEKALRQRQSSTYHSCCAKHAKQLAVLQSFLRDKNASDPSAVIDLLYFLDSLLASHIDSERQALGLYDGELSQ
jgi:hemerythrin-like metal-binding protein